MRRPSRAVRTVFGAALCALLAGGAYGVRVVRRPAAAVRAPTPARRAPPPVGLRALWQVRLPFRGNVTAASRWVVVDGGNDYAILDAETGRPVFPWLPLPRLRRFLFRAGPRPAGRLILRTEMLRALDLDTGAMRWEVAFDGPHSHLPEHFAMTEALVLMCDEGTVTARDDASGATRWTAPVPRCGEMLTDAGRIYVDAPEELIALDARTGARLWTAHTPRGGDPDHGPWVAAAGGRVALGARSAPDVQAVGGVAVLDGATGRRVGEVALPGVVVKSLSARGDLLLVNVRPSPSTDLRVAMISLTTGETLWRRFNTGVGHLLADDAVYVGDANDELLTLDPSSGRELGRQGAVFPYPYTALIPVLDAPSVRFIVATGGLVGDGTLLTGLAGAPTLPVEEVRIEGRRAWDAAADAHCSERGLMRIGDAVVLTHSRGRFRATLRARGSVAIRWGGIDAAYMERPPCEPPISMTLWLDGRSGPYDVTLPVDHSGIIY